MPGLAPGKIGPSVLIDKLGIYKCIDYDKGYGVGCELV
jgi:hypothetical protein